MKKTISKNDDVGAWIVFETEGSLSVEIFRAKTKKECESWIRKHKYESFINKVIGANDKSIKLNRRKKASKKNTNSKNLFRNG